MWKNDGKYRLVEYQYNGRPVKWVVEKRHPVFGWLWGIIESCYREEDIHRMWSNYVDSMADTSGKNKLNATIIKQANYRYVKNHD